MVVQLYGNTVPEVLYRSLIFIENGIPDRTVLYRTVPYANILFTLLYYYGSKIFIQHMHGTLPYVRIFKLKKFSTVSGTAPARYLYR